MIWYAVASLTPAGLLALACLFGAGWPAAAVMSITVVVFFMDKLARVPPVRGESGHRICLALGAVHFGLLALGVWALAADHLDVVDKMLVYTGLGLFFGQVSNSNAHELIHARTRGLRRLGAAIYISLLHGHHVSAHLRVHHVHAATDADPSSASVGEGFWAYARHLVRDEFRAGFAADTAHRRRAKGLTPVWTHPYVGYVLGGGLTLGLAYLVAGAGGVLALVGIAVYAQLQLALSDYVQHYGLRRRLLANGKPEPVGPQHSWNAPMWYSSAMMLNAPRHSDHHMRPARPYPALEVTDDMPLLPRSLPVMAVIALIPPVWRRVMDPRVARWQKPA